MTVPYFYDGLDHYGTTVAKLNNTYQFVGAGLSFVSPLAGVSGRALRDASAANFGIGLNITTRQTITMGIRWRYTHNLVGSPFRIIEFAESLSTQCGLSIDSSGHLQFFRGAGGFGAPGTAVLTSSNTFTQDQEYYIEVTVTVHNSAGVVIVNVDDSNTGWLNSSGIDTQQTGNATIDLVILAGGGTSFDAFSAEYDDWYINAIGDTTFRHPCLILTDFATGEGSENDFTPNAGDTNYTQVDDDPEDGDTTYTEATGAGLRQSFTYPTLSYNPLTIHATAIWSYTKKTDASALSVKLFQKKPSIPSEVLGASVALSTSYAYYRAMFERDPDDSPFTVAGLDLVELGLEIQ